MAAEQSAHSAPALDLSTRLAFERTWVAYERTMLAWVRTATSLITFGFSVYKFFQIVREEGLPRNYLVGSRQFGLLLVSIGLASLALATLEYRQNIRMLDSQYPGRRRSLAVIVAALISVLGIVALAIMIFRV
jgi:putative membrane protein